MTNDLSESRDNTGVGGDLQACDREPIHVPGSVQPHGALLVVRPEDRVIVQVSANTARLLGRAPAEILGRPLADFLPPAALSALPSADADDGQTVVLGAVALAEQRTVEATAHRHAGALLVELELPVASSPAESEIAPAGRQHRAIQSALAAMRETRDLPELCTVAARAVAELTGFERVMVYRFDDDWHGEVLGEALAGPDIDSYLGLHFPASDIPAQARALYTRNRLRLIPTVDYAPVGLEPPLNPLSGGPLDLSFASLRSVSPVHLEYLRNMGVGASMSISLLIGGRLWGLIACHHRTARFLDPATRAACELFGEIAAAAIAAQQETRRLAEHMQAQRIQTRFFDVLAQEGNFVDALVKYTPQLLEFMQASGAAIWVNEQCSRLGAAPEPAEIVALVGWLKDTGRADPIFATDRLGDHFAPAADYATRASGLLAVRLSRVEPHFVLFFRPEVRSTVTWAGNPEKPVVPGTALHPRKSFAAWQETVTGRSLPWHETDLAGARELLQAINALVLRRTERLIALNAELERKNSDLNSFSYIAAHDIQEPIRGILNFSRFLREDSGHRLDAESLRKLDTITALAGRTEELLNALLHFSRVGRIDLQLRPTDLDRLLDEVLETLERPPPGRAPPRCAGPRRCRRCRAIRCWCAKCLRT